MKIGNYAVPNGIVYALGIVVLLLAAWHFWPSGGDEKSGAASAIELPANITGSAEFMGQIVPTSDNAYYVGGRWIAKPAPVETTPAAQNLSVSEAGTPDQEQSESGAEPEPAKGKKLVLKLSAFEDWVNGELSIKDTDITEFQVFGSKKDAQDFVDEYAWNDKHDFKWNYDEYALFVANEYGESDPAPAVFFSTTTAYFVVLSGDGVTADFYELNTKKKESGELIEKKSGEKSVYAVDQLETDAS